MLICLFFLNVIFLSIVFGMCLDFDVQYFCIVFTHIFVG